MLNDGAVQHLTFTIQHSTFSSALQSLANRHVLLFGGKGGVGKTTIAKMAASIFEKKKRVVFLSVESLDAEALYKKFLDRNLDAFLELGDRGTYRDHEDVRRFFELSRPRIAEIIPRIRLG